MSDSGKLTIVVAGLGGISKAWLKPLTSFSDVAIAGLVDISPGQAEKARAEYGLNEAWTGTSTEDAIEAVKPDIVCDCTVPSARFSVVTAALSRGCHVFSEKPMAESMDEARRMCKLARETGKTFGIMQNRRHLSSIHRFRESIRPDSIGKLTTLNADFYLDPHFGGFRDEMEHVLLLDMAIHTFDQARFISQADPVSVYCHEWNPSGSWYKHGASAIALFEMTGGIIFTYRGSWCAAGMKTSWEAVWRAVGEQGTSCWDGGAQITGERPCNEMKFIRDVEPITVPPLVPFAHEWHGAAIRDYLDSIRDNRQPKTPCHDNIKSLAMVHAAIESAKTGKKVRINQS